MAERPVVTVALAAMMLGEEPEAIHRLAEEGRIALVTAPDGSVDVCMESLNELQSQ